MESKSERKVAVLGAAGGIGQPLCPAHEALSSCPLALFLYDIVGTPGVFADVSHVNTVSQVAGFTSKDLLCMVTFMDIG